HVGMELRVGQPHIIRGPGREMVECSSDDIASDDVFLAAALPRQSIALDLDQGTFHSARVGGDQPVVSADECLDADRLWGRKYAVPAGAMFAIMSRGGNEYRPRTWGNALQQGAEIFAADVAGELKIGGALADPMANTPLALGVIVVNRIMLV